MLLFKNFTKLAFCKIFVKGLVQVKVGITSQGGGADRYEGTILNVTDPRASRWNSNIDYILSKSLCGRSHLLFRAI